MATTVFFDNKNRKLPGSYAAIGVTEPHTVQFSPSYKELILMDVNHNYLYDKDKYQLLAILNIL